MRKKIALPLRCIIAAFLLVSTGCALLGGTAPVAAAPASTSKSSQSTQGSIHGYSASSVLQNGLIVELNTDDTVSVATKERVEHMYGVTVDSQTLLFTISSAGLVNPAYVATSGTYPVLVSNESGAIKAGDYVTVSSISGIAMSAGNLDTTTLGRAIVPFNGTTDSIGTQTLTKSDGSTTTVSLGLIPVAINISHNPNRISTKADLPKLLVRLGQAIAEKPISPIRIYLSVGITTICTIIAMVILYSGVRNGIISIGRNPLSKRTILRGLVTIILTSLIVLTTGLFAVYLLLKL